MSVTARWDFDVAWITIACQIYDDAAVRADQPRISGRNARQPRERGAKCTAPSRPRGSDDRDLRDIVTGMHQSSRPGVIPPRQSCLPGPASGGCRQGGMDRAGPRDVAAARVTGAEWAEPRSLSVVPSGGRAWRRRAYGSNSSGHSPDRAARPAGSGHGQARSARHRNARCAHRRSRD